MIEQLAGTDGMKTTYADVFVAGGGPAGVCAAIAAAREGAATVMAEQGGCAGGMATQGLVGPFMTCYDKDGENMIIRGLFAEIVDRLVKRGGAIHPSQVRKGTAFTSWIRDGHDHVTPFDPEILKMMTAIGQGNTLMTPMHMALLMCAVANDGVLMTPRFLKRTESYTGMQVESYPVTTYGQLMTEEEAQTLQLYLRAVVEEGTGTKLQSDVYEAAGKTGTAEYSSNKKQSHAWFAGYASGSKDDLVVVAIVEGAGSGSEYAIPIAKKVFDAYYKE